jgi:hypothetical protein
MATATCADAGFTRAPMSRRRWIDRCMRWTTLWALAIATLAPSVAHALHHVRGGELVPWSVLCTATGVKRVVLDTSVDGQAPLQHAHAFHHCAACALHHDCAAPPQLADAVVLRADLAHRVPQLFLQAPRPLHAWRGAQPRAPPAQT